MFQTDFTRLGLRVGSAVPTVNWRVISERLLALANDLVAHVNLGDVAELKARLEECRTALGGGGDSAMVVRLIDESIEACRRALLGADGHRAAVKQEIAALVALVREALAAITGDADTFDQSLSQSAERFAGLAKMEDVRELKRQLSTEVQILRHLAIERQRAWAETREAFTRRVETLEAQLTATKRDAMLDPLTRIPNRSVFDAAGREWAAGGRRQFVLALIDVDNLKTINDTHGHSVGDRALTAVAQAIAGSVRAGTDVVARIGGDEFAVLASDLALQQAEHRMQMIIASLARATRDGEPSLKLTLSCGIAECSAGDTLESLSERADVALYQAKRLGKNRVVTVVKPTLQALMQR